MKQVSVVATLVVVVGIALVWWSSQRRDSAIDGGGAAGVTPPAPSQPERPPEPGATPPQPVQPAAPAGPIVLKVPTVSTPPREAPQVVLTGATARVQSDLILADVNGAAITLKDLVAVGPSSVVERALSPEMYTFLLNRAIAREVAFQVAKESGVTLGDEQLRQLDAIRARAMERDPASFTDVHDDFAANAEFEVRDFAGLMTQDALLAAAGGPPKYVTSEMVQEYYQSHSQQYGDLPADPEARQEAWQVIEVDIRGQLAEPVAAEHTKALDEMMSDLVGQSRHTLFVTPATNAAAAVVP